MSADVSTTDPIDPHRGLTPAEVARLLRISADRVRAMLLRGDLGGANTAPPGARPRYVVLPWQVREWVDRHSAAKPKPAPRRKRRDPEEHDYYPD